MDLKLLSKEHEHLLGRGELGFRYNHDLESNLPLTDGDEAPAPRTTNLSMVAMLHSAFTLPPIRKEIHSHPHCIAAGAL